MNDITELLHNTFGDSFLFLKTLENSGFLREQDTFCIRENGLPVSVMFVKKYPLNLPSGTVWADYVFYAATAQEMRGKGLMSSLINDTLQKLKNQGGACAVLIPASPSLYAFYASFGFQTAFYVKKTVYNPAENEHKVYIPSKNEAESFYPKYYEKYGKMQYTVYKTEELFRQSVSENLCETENSAILTDGEAFAFASFNETVVLREFVGDDIKVFSEAVGAYYDKIVIAVEPTKSGGEPQGMALMYSAPPKAYPPLYMDNMLN